MDSQATDTDIGDSRLDESWQDAGRHRFVRAVLSVAAVPELAPRGAPRLASGECPLQVAR